MNSNTLIETGFSECISMKNLSFSTLPQDKSSVIVILDKELSGKSESDILYIGRAKKTAKKIMGGYLAGYGGKSTKKINQMLFDEGYIEKAAISWTLTDKPRLMQKELLAKFKEAHGEVPKWNTKKKLAVKPKETPASKLKTPILKTTSAAPKVIANSVAKSIPKPKVLPTKKSAAKDELSAKTESSTKSETSPVTLEKEKTKNEAPSDKQMPT
jgi:hypothetical protein